MSLVERLRNPQWESDGHAVSLSVDYTRATMDEAAAEIERLADDLQECESRYMELSYQFRSSQAENERLREALIILKEHLGDIPLYEQKNVSHIVDAALDNTP